MQMLKKMVKEVFGAGESKKDRDRSNGESKNDLNDSKDKKDSERSIDVGETKKDLKNANV